MYKEIKRMTYINTFKLYTLTYLKGNAVYFMHFSVVN